jgi:acetolactate synthase-1/2/3 large subunit
LCTHTHDPKKCPIPDFVKIAEAFGGVGFRLTKKEEVVSVLKKAFEIKEKPVVIDFIVEDEENVFPMVPAGASLDEIMINLA